jgi:hypothetical protein
VRPGIVREAKGRGTSDIEAATKHRLVKTVTDCGHLCVCNGKL